MKVQALVKESGAATQNPKKKTQRKLEKKKTSTNFCEDAITCFAADGHFLYSGRNFGHRKKGVKFENLRAHKSPWRHDSNGWRNRTIRQIWKI